MKMSKKQLTELAQMLGAKKYTSNVYNYENIVYYMQSLASGNGGAYDNAIHNCNEEHKKELENVLDEIVATISSSIRTQQLAYSAGVYGNNGQLHEIMLLRDGEEVKTIYLYY